MSNHEDHRSLCEGIWKTIIIMFNQEGRTRVQIPSVPVVNALATIIANVIAQMPAEDRAQMLSDVGPMIAHVVAAARNKPDIYIPSRNGLVM